MKKCVAHIDLHNDQYIMFFIIDQWFHTMHDSELIRRYTLDGAGITILLETCQHLRHRAEMP